MRHAMVRIMQGGFSFGFDLFATGGPGVSRRLPLSSKGRRCPGVFRRLPLSSKGRRCPLSGENSKHSFGHEMTLFFN